MADALKQFLEQMEARIMDKFAIIETGISSLDFRIEQIEDAVRKIDEHFTRAGTTLMTEFQKWASPIEIRLRTMEEQAARQLARQLEDRISALERRNPIG